MPLKWPLAVLFALGGAALLVSPVVSTVALALCAVWALIGPLQAIQAMALSTLIGYMNPALQALAPVSGVLIRLVLLLSAIRVLPLTRAAQAQLLWPTWAFAAFAAVSALGVSPAISISIMKVITFVAGSTTAVVAFCRLEPEQISRLRIWLFTLATTVAALSAATLVVPAIAFHLNGKGLQGVLSHPQALGTVLAPFAAWWLTGIVVSSERLRAAAIVVAVGTLAVMLLTQARTALIATVLGVVAAAVTRTYGSRATHAGSNSRLAWIGLACVVGLMLSALAGDEVLGFAKGFLLKRTEDSSVSQAFLDSRGYGIVAEWQNFLSAPFTGHGFGVYADGSFPSGVSMFAGIPISAPVEKGFVPTAVLEETGLPGGLLLYFAVFWLGRHVWRSADLRWIAMFVAALGINAGEAVILSPGGMGLLIWIVIGLCCTGPLSPAAGTAMPSAIGSDSDNTAEAPRRFNIMRCDSFA